MLTIGLAETTPVMMLSAVLGLFMTLGFASLPAFLAKLVPTDEVGKILGFYGFCNSMASILSNITVNGVYAVTAEFWPGLSFILIAALVAICWVGMFIVRTLGG